MNNVKHVIRKIIFFPFIFKKLWDAEEALKNKNWEQLSHLICQLHNKDFASNKTRFWLASALLHLNNNEEALVEFERIRENLEKQDEEASRYWNHAISLYRTGNKEESVKLLLEKINAEWPSATFLKARKFLSDSGVRDH